MTVDTITARKIAYVSFRASSDLAKLRSIISEEEPEEEIDGYRKALLAAIQHISTNITNRVLDAHPEIRRELDEAVSTNVRVDPDPLFR